MSEVRNYTPTRSVMDHNFSRVPSVEIPRSSFDRSHGVKTTFDSGWLIPILVDEALPGDTFNVSLTALARLATPIKPIMDNMFLDTFFFAVPNRLVWENWEKFNGAQDNPGDSTDYTIPQITAPTTVVENSLYDYMGIPPGVPNVSINALPIRSYHLIWNEWFRDENLQNSAIVRKTDASESYNDYSLKRRGKRHDYFTSCLPWPQKGNEIQIPLGTTAPVRSAGNGFPLFTAAGTADPFALQTRTGTTEVDKAGFNAGQVANLAWSDPRLETDLSAASAATINSLRLGFQIQRMLERDARGGTRYTEIIRSHFGVISPDARLQRPEYLGGGTTMVNVNPVAQTSDINIQNTPKGDLSAYGQAIVGNHGFTKSFTEHCTIIGLVCVRADLTYQQGLNRMWSRTTRYDFYWPALSHIGEQAVLNKEIYWQGDGDTNDNQVFGYQERYAEYRYKPSLVTARMRSKSSAKLDVWHLAQEFDALPTLNDTFIVENPPVKRTIAVQAEPDFLFDGYFSMRCARPMPMYGVPGMIDHF